MMKDLKNSQFALQYDSLFQLATILPTLAMNLWESVVRLSQ